MFCREKGIDLPGLGISGALANNEWSFTMRWKHAGIGLLALGGIVGGPLMTSGGAQAADGCGPGWYRNVYGDCRPGGRRFYGPPRVIGFGFGGGGWGGHHHGGGWGGGHHHGGGWGGGGHHHR